MGFHCGPRIIKEGLILLLDASDKNSYDGSSTWYSLAGSLDHTLVAVTSTDGGKALAFNGSTSKATYSGAVWTSSTTCTVQIFMRTTDTICMWLEGGGVSHFLSRVDTTSPTYFHSNFGTPTNYIDLQTVTNPTSPTNYHNGSYHMFEAKNVDLSTDTVLQWFWNSGFMMAADVSKIMVYNRNLTTAESAQNYAAMKQRLNLA